MAIAEVNTRILYPYIIGTRIEDFFQSATFTVETSTKKDVDKILTRTAKILLDIAPFFTLLVLPHNKNDIVAKGHFLGKNWQLVCDLRYCGMASKLF